MYNELANKEANRIIRLVISLPATSNKQEPWEQARTK
jgi:hypothetical protein